MYRAASALLKKCTRYFFQRDTSSEAVVIAIVEADPLVEIVSVFSSRHSTRVVAYNPHFYTKRGSDPYHFPPYSFNSLLRIVVYIKQT